ncbi:hypothetical protein [Streptomyces atacamensis]|uniref:hypothetical protein n=1 Tax=Streptomyces atacamensis TaxID=531966 RepID=UPI00399D477D
MATETRATETPYKGDLVRDVRRDRTGVVMDRIGGCYWLRPAGGGKEWQAKTEDLKPVTRIDHLSARVAEANGRSRR